MIDDEDDMTPRALILEHDIDVNLIVEDQDDPTHISTQKSRPIVAPPEEFYGQPDSIYIRVQWNPDISGGAFSFLVRNELIHNLKDDEELPEEVAKLGAFVRGMLEMAMAFPSKCFEVGCSAQNAEIIAETDGLTEEQKDLLMGQPKGSA